MDKYLYRPKLEARYGQIAQSFAIGAQFLQSSRYTHHHTRLRAWLASVAYSPRCTQDDRRKCLYANVVRGQRCHRDVFYFESDDFPMRGEMVDFARWACKWTLEWS